MRSAGISPFDCTTSARFSARLLALVRFGSPSTGFAGGSPPSEFPHANGTAKPTGEGVVSYTDQTLTCRDCGALFPFTASEQEFYASKGFDNPPSRCPSCRAARKAQRSQGGGSDWGYSDRPRERQMFTVACSSCGQDAQVPFEPTQGRPVYCSDCFNNQRSGGGAGGGRRESYR
jgi:CxxC-x17-CxxC domain-containing protein